MLQKLRSLFSSMPIFFILMAVSVLLLLTAPMFAGNFLQTTVQEPGYAVLLPSATQSNARGSIYQFDRPDTQNGHNLFFFTTHHHINVYANDQLIYRLTPSKNSIGAATTGAGWNVVLIPEDTTLLRVEMQPIYSGIPNRNVVFYLGNAYYFMRAQMRADTPAVLLYLLSIAIGLAMIIFWFVFHRSAPLNYEILLCGFFSGFYGLWALFETNFIRLITYNNAAASFASFILLLMTALAFALFVKFHTQPRERWISFVLVVALFVHGVLSPALHFLGIASLRETVFITHSLAVATLLYYLYAIVDYVHRAGFDGKTYINISGLALIIVSVSVDLYQYYKVQISPNLSAKIALPFFIVMLAGDSLRHALDLIVAGRKAEIYKELAEVDSLTQLRSRTAYSGWLASQQSPEGIAIITFDLNDLKLCNDTKGHAMGDLYLTCSAQMISSVFSPHGVCYRIGGDEFLVALHDVTEANIIGLLHELGRLQRQYNKSANPITIHIAYGYAIFDPAVDHEIEDTRCRADAKMYQMKAALKANCPPECPATCEKDCTDCCRTSAKDYCL